MVSRALIKAAVKAANAPQPVAGSVAGMAAAYGDMYGAGRNYANFLPRPTQDFTAAGFAPGSPIRPVGVDVPGDGEERPEPRRFGYPVAWNLPIGQPGTEGLGKLADFGTLRQLAEYSSIARACIQLRKAEIRSLAWTIVPTKDAAKAMRGSEDKHSDFAERKAKAAKFFKRPDPNYSDFSSWLDAALEAVFVLDALSIYLQPTRGKGKGLLGSSLGALCLIDGSSIRPLLDVHGARPRPPSPAFQQYIYGVPRTDLMTIITGDDLAELDAPVATYRGDQLLYLPMSPRDWSPYGQAPAERCLIPIIASLQRQTYQSQFYSEGTIPSVFVSPGDPNLTPQNIAALQGALNGIAGDPAWKHKIIVLPGGSRVDPMHPVSLADQFDEVIAVQVCMGYDVMPMELGISPKVSTTQSPGAANQMAKASKGINDRKSLRPLLGFLKSALFDQVLQDICGQSDMEWKWEGLEEGEDEASLVGNLVVQVNNGIISHDEARSELGREPWNLPITSDPGVLTAQGFVPLGAIDPQTGLPAAEQPALPAEAAEVAPPAPPPGDDTGGSAPAKPKPGPAPGGTPSHAGAQAAVDEHARQGPGQAAKPSDGSKTPSGSSASTGKMVVKASPDHSGGSMLALYPPQEVAEGLTVPGGLAWDELHLTVAYLGDAADVGREVAEKAAEALAARGPIAAQISGHARFTGGDQGDVIVALVDSPDLEVLRRDALDLLAGLGVDVPSDHGYTPHITLTYQPVSRATPMKRLDAQPVTFSAVSLVHGPDRVDVRFQRTARKRWASTDKPLTGQAATDAVYEQLADDYPVDALGWVRDASWTGPEDVPLDRIDTSNKDTWQASKEPGKVERFKDKIRHKLGKGKPLKPIVLVKTPGNTKLIVIDGHHRTLAYEALGLPAVAWVGTVDADTGPWDTLHSQQLPETERGDDTRQTVPSSKAVMSEWAALCRHLRKGTDPATWKTRHLPAVTVATITEELGKGLSVDQAIRAARSTLPSSDDQEGEQPAAKAKKPAWPGWEVDLQLAAFHATRISGALSGVLSAQTARRIADGWLAVGTNPAACLQKTAPGLAEEINGALRAVLTPLWTTGWAVGTVSAQAVLYGKRVDWSRYIRAVKAEGDPPTTVVDPSLMVYDQASLQTWLDHYGITTITGITGTRMDELASLLEQALADGASPDSLASEIEALGVGTASADMIAITEISRAMSQAALANYQQAGVGAVSWMTAQDQRVCMTCDENEANSPIPIGEAFANGIDAPPAHPLCRCCIQPADLGGVSLPSSSDLQDILGGFD